MPHTYGEISGRFRILWFLLRLSLLNDLFLESLLTFNLYVTYKKTDAKTNVAVVMIRRSTGPTENRSTTDPTMDSISPPEGETTMTLWNRSASIADVLYIGSKWRTESMFGTIRPLCLHRATSVCQYLYLMDRNTNVYDSPIVLDDLGPLTVQRGQSAGCDGVRNGFPLDIVTIGAEDVDIDLAVICMLDPKSLPVGTGDECCHIGGFLHAHDLEAFACFCADEHDARFSRDLILVHSVRAFELVSVNDDGLHGITL